VFNKDFILIVLFLRRAKTLWKS